MKILQKLTDTDNAASLANRLRRKRFAFFESLLSALPRPLTILDIGGTQTFWDNMEFSDDKVAIQILNIHEVEAIKPGFSSIVGDACSLVDFHDDEIDVVFSNSVIEHVGDFNDQMKMANEIVRVGKRFFVQTPNYYFPFEPHFLFPCFQFLPKVIQMSLVRNFRLGWTEKAPDENTAEKLTRSVQLLREREVRKLFPTAEIYKENFMGLTKSLVAYGGWGIQ